MAPIFLYFHFLHKTRRLGPFFAKIKELIYKKGQYCIQLVNIVISLEEKISKQGFSSFYIIISFAISWRETIWVFKISSKMSKIWQIIGKKWRKSIFSFLFSIFREKQKIEEVRKHKILCFGGTCHTHNISLNKLKKWFIC